MLSNAYANQGKRPRFFSSIPIVPRALSFSLSPASLRYKDASAEDSVLLNEPLIGVNQKRRNILKET